MFGNPLAVTGLPRQLAPIVRDPEGSALLLDFDGTLAPIVTDPAAARLPPEGLGILDELQMKVALVAIVSGRPVNFLRDALGSIPVTLVGLYGTERIIDGVPIIDESVDVFRPIIEEAARQAEDGLPGLLIERKGVSFVIHWRDSLSRELEAIQHGRMIADRFALTAELGRMALEVYPPTRIDKGKAVLTLAQGYNNVLFAGDDRGDIPAFRALRQHALRTGTCGVLVAVVSDEAPAELNGFADLVVDGPAGFLLLLKLLQTALRQPGI
jgi:trehalose 6-phosphate phosphatase